jgi:hypothetical protein
VSRCAHFDLPLCVWQIYLRCRARVKRRKFNLHCHVCFINSPSASIAAPSLSSSFERKFCESKKFIPISRAAWAGWYRCVFVHVDVDLLLLAGAAAFLLRQLKSRWCRERKMA